MLYIGREGEREREKERFNLALEGQREMLAAKAKVIACALGTFWIYSCA